MLYCSVTIKAEEEITLIEPSHLRNEPLSFKSAFTRDLIYLPVQIIKVLLEFDKLTNLFLLRSFLCLFWFGGRKLTVSKTNRRGHDLSGWNLCAHVKFSASRSKSSSSSLVSEGTGKGKPCRISSASCSSHCS